MKKKTLIASAILALASATLLGACGGPSTPAESSGQGTSQGSQAVAKYKINLPTSNEFEITGISEAEAEEGQRVSFQVVVKAEGKVVSAVKVDGEVITPSSTGRYRFEMPAHDVTITVELLGVDSIALDTANVKKLFLVGGTFDYEGLVVKAKFSSGAEETVTTGVVVTTPDLTSAGTKVVSVTYGGVSASYEIKVGSLKGDDIDIRLENDRVIFSVLGAFSGFADAAELTAAAKGAYLLDFQNNNNIGGQGWTRPIDVKEITFLAAGEGRFKVDVDVTDLPGSGSGFGYTLHFGLPQTEGSDAGCAGDMKLTNENEHPNDNKTVTLGKKQYTISCNVGVGNDGTRFWGCCGLIVADAAAPTVKATGVTARVDGQKLYIEVSGIYANVTQDVIDNDGFYCDIMQFDSWAKVGMGDEITGNAAPQLTLTDSNAEGGVRNGSFVITFDVTGELNANGDYFLHFGPQAEGATDHPNLAWNGETMTESTTAFDDALITIDRNTRTDWAGGLVRIHYLGGDYVLPQSVTLVNEGNKALLKVGGAYSGIINNDNGDYYLDCMDFTSNADISNGGVDCQLTLTPDNGGANKGKFEIVLDVTGKLTAGEDYYCHFGPLPEGSEYRSNLKAPDGMEPASFNLGEGTYTLSVASGYTDSTQTWRNGLAIVSYTTNAA